MFHISYAQLAIDRAVTGTWVLTPDSSGFTGYSLALLVSKGRIVLFSIHGKSFKMIGRFYFSIFILKIYMTTDELWDGELG